MSTINTMPKRRQATRSTGPSASSSSSMPAPMAPTLAALAAHPGQPRLTNPRTRNRNGQNGCTRSNARNTDSPVASVQRCISVLMKNCVRTPKKKAQYSAQPCWAMRTGQNSVSPLPSEAPSMMALGPTTWESFGTRGRSRTR